jgi:hypothetical protein
MAGVLTVAAMSCSDTPSERLGATVYATPESDQTWTDDDYASAVPQEIPGVVERPGPSAAVVTGGVITVFVGVVTGTWLLRRRHRR